MKIFIELVIYCLVFTVLVKAFAGNDPLNCLYFYPRVYQEKAYEMDLADRETVRKKRTAFLIIFTSLMFLLLVIIIAFINKVEDFKTAYLQSLLFLEVMNCYDGIIIDKVWVGKDPFWKIEEMGDTPYIQTWDQVFKKRSFLALFWLAGSIITALAVIIL